MNETVGKTEAKGKRKKQEGGEKRLTKGGERYKERRVMMDGKGGMNVEGRMEGDRSVNAI